MFCFTACLLRYQNPRFHPSWTSAGPHIGVIMLRLLAEPVNWCVTLKKVLGYFEEVVGYFEEGGMVL